MLHIFSEQKLIEQTFKMQNQLHKYEETRQKNHIFFKKNILKDLETNETIKQNTYLKKYWTKK